MYELGKFIKIRIKVEVSLISLLFNYDINMSWLGGGNENKCQTCALSHLNKESVFQLLSEYFF